MLDDWLKSGARQATGGADLAGSKADFLKVGLGMLARNVLRGLVKLTIAGLLAPRAFGLLRAVVALFSLAASLAEFGLHHATVTLVSAALGRGEMTETDRLLRAVLGLKVIIMGTALLAGGLLAGPIARLALGDESLTMWVRVALFAVCGQVLWGYVSSFLSAHRAYGRLAAFMPTMPALMLVATGVLAGLGRFDTRAGILIYLLAPAATVGLWWLIVRTGMFRAPTWERPLLARIVRFSRWTFATAAASSMRNNANTLLVKHPALAGGLAAGEANAGVYAFGADLAAEITVFSESLMAVLLPRAASRSKAAELKRFMARAYRNLALLLPPLALLLLLAEPFIRLLGMISDGFLAYLPSADVFAILWAGALFSLAAIPARAVLYALEAPKVEAWIEMAGVPLVIGLGIWLIPTQGLEAAAWILAGQRAVTCLADGAAALALLARRRAQETS